MPKSIGRSFSDLFSKIFAKGRAKCVDCGNEWNVVYLRIKGGEYKLQCPKCNKRNSKIIDTNFKTSKK